MASDDNRSQIAKETIAPLTKELFQLNKLWTKTTATVAGERYDALVAVLQRLDDLAIYNYLQDLPFEETRDLFAEVQRFLGTRDHGFLDWGTTGGDSVYAIVVDIYLGVSLSWEEAAVAMKGIAKLFVLSDLLFAVVEGGLIFEGAVVSRKVPSPVVATVALYAREVLGALSARGGASAKETLLVERCTSLIARYNEEAYRRVLLAPKTGNYQEYSENAFLKFAGSVETGVRARDSALGPWAQDEEASRVYQAGRALLKVRAEEVDFATAEILSAVAGNFVATKAKTWKFTTPPSDDVTNSPSRLQEKGRYNVVDNDDEWDSSPSASSAPASEVTADAADGLRTMLNTTVQTGSYTFAQELDTVNSASFNLDVCSSQLMGF